MNEFLIASTILLWAAVLFNLLLSFALVRRLNAFMPPMSETLSVGQRAPDFTAETVEGETVTLASFAGRTAAFVFVSPSCSPCKQEIPTLEALYPKAKLAGVDLVLVSDSMPEDARVMVGEFHLSIPVVVASRLDNDLMSNYKVSGTPFYCVVDIEGRVQATGLLDNAWRKLSGQWEAGEPRSIGRRPVVSLAALKGGD